MMCFYIYTNMCSFPQQSFMQFQIIFISIKMLRWGSQQSQNYKRLNVCIARPGRPIWEI